MNKKVALTIGTIASGGAATLAIAAQDAEENKKSEKYLSSFSRPNITKENAKEFLKNPNSPSFAGTNKINAFAFEGLKIPKDFVFPERIKFLEEHSFSKTTFEGNFSLPSKVTLLGDGLFEEAIFNGTKLELPNNIEDLWFDTFLNSKWNNGAYLDKLPDSLRKLRPTSLLISNNYGVIPLSTNFTLENTKIISIDHTTGMDNGAFYKYKLPQNFKLPKTIMYIGSLAFNESDFSNLPYGKIGIKDKDVIIDSDAGLRNKMVYESTERKYLTRNDISAFLSNPNDEQFEDFVGINQNAFSYVSIPDGFVFPEHIKNIASLAFENSTIGRDVRFSSATKFIGDSIFKSATFRDNLILPDSIETLGEATFINSKWLFGSYLERLPNNLKELHSNVFIKNSYVSSNSNMNIPLSPNFTLANTKVEILHDSFGINDNGLFYKYILPKNFNFSPYLKYIGKHTFNGTIFNNLTNGKIDLHSLFEVRIHKESGINFDENLNVTIDDEDLLNSMELSDIPLPVVDPNILPSSVSKPNKGTLFSGVDYEFIDWIQNDETGTINYKINISINGSKTKEIKSQLIGYKLKQDFDKEELAKAVQNLKDFDGEENTKQASNEDFLNISWVHQKVISKLENVSSEQLELFKENNIEVISRDNNRAEITIRISGFGNDKTIKITGFQTNQDKQEANDTNDINNVVEIDIMLPEANDKIFAASIENWDGRTFVTNSGVNYKFVKWESDDDKGEIEWSVLLTKGLGTSKTLSGTITGYLTNYQNNMNKLSEYIQNLGDMNLGIKSKMPKYFDESWVYTKLIDNMNKFLTKDQVDLFFKNNISINHNNQNGSIFVSIKNYGEVKQFKIFGFQTQDEFDVANVAKSDFTSTIEVNDNKTPDQIGIPFNGVIGSEVNYKITKWEINKDRGEIVWEIELSKGSANPRILSGILSGFKTQLELDGEAIDSAIQNLEDFDGEESSQQASDSSRFDLEWIFSKILGFLDHLSATQKELFQKANIDIINRNDESGIISITIKNHGPNKNLVIFGFLTNEEKSVQEDVDLINSIKEVDLNLPEGDINVLPSEEENYMNKLGSTDNGVNYKFVKWIDNNINGTIYWKVELTYGQGGTRIMEGTIKGYSTIEVRSIKLIKEALSAINSINIGDRSKLPSNSEFDLDWIYKNIYDYLDITFTSLDPDELDFLNQEHFEISSINNDNGIINVEIKFHGLEKIMQLYGFQTQDNYDLNQITSDDFDLIFKSDSNKLPSEVKVLEKGKVGQGVSYIVDEWNYNDVDGTISWKVTLQKNLAGPKELTGIVIGYMTQLERDKALVTEEVQKLLDRITNSDFNDFKATNFIYNEEFFASYLKKLMKNLNDRQLNLFTENNISLDKNNEKGEISISIVGFGSKKIVVAYGFLTNDQSDVNDVNDFNFNLPYGDRTKLPSEIPHRREESGIVGKNVNYKFVKWIADNENGNIEYTIELTKGDNAYGIISGIIIGFKTNEDVYREILAREIWKLGDINVQDAKWLPSDPSYTNQWIVDIIKKELNYLNQNVLDYLLPEDIENSPNDFEGHMEIKIYNHNLNSTNDVSTEGKSLKITGFKTLEAEEDEQQTIMDSITIDDILNLPVVDGDIYATTVAKPESSITNSGVSYTFVEWNTNDKTGTINWKVICTSPHAKDKEISGVLQGYKIRKFASAGSKLILAIGLPLVVTVTALLSFLRIRKAKRKSKK